MTEQEQKLFQMVVNQRDALASQVNNLIIDKQLLIEELATLKAPKETPTTKKKA